MGYIFLFCSLITGFIMIYDMTFSLLTYILIILGLYLVRKKHLNMNFTRALYCSILEIPLNMYAMLIKSDLYVIALLKLFIFYFIFIGFIEISVHPISKKLSYVAFTLIIIHTIGIAIMTSFTLLPPQVTGLMTWVFIKMGWVITLLGFIIIIRNMKRKNNC